jgi:hypothetical protein
MDHCIRLQDRLRVSQDRWMAKNGLAIVQSCRDAKDRALQYYNHFSWRRSIRVMTNHDLHRILLDVKRGATDTWGSVVALSVECNNLSFARALSLSLVTHSIFMTGIGMGHQS